ncbi:MAG: hypothetical protein IJB98_00225 [Clostridia bacterium]|nr:hypothetical protein [Clostridia bacterium]
MNNKFIEFNEKKRILGYYINILDDYFKILEASKSMIALSVEGASASRIDKKIEALKIDVAEYRDRAWEDWYLYTDELKCMEEAMKSFNEDDFEFAETNLNTIISDAERDYQELMTLNKELSFIFGDAKLNFGQGKLCGENGEEPSEE